MLARISARRTSEDLKPLSAVPCHTANSRRIADAVYAFRMYVGAAGRPDPRRRIDIAPGSRRLCESGDL